MPMKSLDRSLVEVLEALVRQMDDGSILELRTLAADALEKAKAVEKANAKLRRLVLVAVEDVR